MVSDSLDGSSPDYRFELCESCEDYAEERRDAERQDAMLEEYVGEEPYYAHEEGGYSE